MTLAPTRTGTALRHAFGGAATEPGLFDRPDRALAALRALAADVYAPESSRVDQLRKLLAAADTRFWTEATMREYVALVNEILGELGCGLQSAGSSTVRLGAKSCNQSSGRYTLFRIRARRGGADTCRRNFPDGLSLVEGPP